MNQTDRDSALKQEVIRELLWDTRIDERRIGVEVEGGVVTLSGTVGSYAVKLAAQEAAHAVTGVRDVVNDIQVKYTGVWTDADIAQAVRHTLEWDFFIHQERIRSSVANGTVTLEGDVECMSEREEAAEVVCRLAGVQNVINKIQVKPSASLIQVQHAIEAALRRHARRHGRDIKLTVQDGNVVLEGKVHSWSERKCVVGAIRGTHGVRSIEDHLQIWPE